MACVENLFAASPLVLPCFPPQVVVTNVYFIQGLGFVVPQRTWNTFCCTTIYIQEPYFVKGCKDLDDFVCKAFIIVIHSELLNNQCEAKYQWLWPVWSQLEVFKSPTEHFFGASRWMQEPTTPMASQNLQRSQFQKLICSTKYDFPFVSVGG